MKHDVYVIAAVDLNFGIGRSNDLPWHFKKDMEFFKEITTKTRDPNKKNMLIMGSRTWESIPEKYRPFKDRENVVLAFDPEYKAKGAHVFDDINDALMSAGDDVENIFFIGGGMIYAEAVKHPSTDGIYLTHIENSYECDTFFPEIQKKFSKETLIKEEKENGIKLSFKLHTT